MKQKRVANFKFLLAGLMILLFVGGFFYIVYEPEMESSVPFSKDLEQKSSETFKDVKLLAPDRLAASSIDETVKLADQEKIVTEKPEKVLESSSLEADFGIEGAVFALDSGLPLNDCQVKFNGQSLATDQAGEFHLWLEGGVGRLSFSSVGFKTLTISQFDTRAGSGMAHFDVYLNELKKPGKGWIEVNGVGGRVYDHASGAPLEGAKIAIGRMRVVTDDAGFFDLWGNNSSLMTMMVSASGYVSEMISGIDFENRNNPFFYEISLKPKQPGEGRIALVGIGARLLKTEAGYEIIDILANSPAAKEGLVSGDRLVVVDSLSVDDFSLREIVELIRGQVGLPVTLVVERGGDFLEFTCLRERVVY